MFQQKDANFKGLRGKKILIMNDKLLKKSDIFYINSYKIIL
jgi:hypothetical protein